MKENLLIDKSIVFASRIVKLHQHLTKTKKETIISKQIVRNSQKEKSHESVTFLFVLLSILYSLLSFI